MPRLQLRARPDRLDARLSPRSGCCSDWVLQARRRSHETAHDWLAFSRKCIEFSTIHGLSGVSGVPPAVYNENGS